MAGNKTAAKKSPAGKSPAKKLAAKKSPADKSPAKKLAARKAPAKKPAPNKGATSKPAARKSAAGAADNYTRPDLREKVKQQVIAGDKGGRPGQWSARKAQLVAHEYEAQGGGYKHPRDAAQQSLKKWGDEHWHTEDGKQAVQAGVTHRYLPDAAWKELSPAQRKETDRKKVAGSRHGKQFIPNTPAASRARKHATDKEIASK